MTGSENKPSSREMQRDEHQETAEALIHRIPQLVPDDHMEFGAWHAWVQPVLNRHPSKFDADMLPLIHAASEAAVAHRLSFDPWPQFTRAMRALVPDMAPDAIVFEVDTDGGGSDINCPNTQFKAGRIAGNELISQVWSKQVAKSWLREFYLADEIEQAKKKIPEALLALAEEGGWRVGHVPQDEVPGVVLVHDDLERVWPADDAAGALRDIGLSVEPSTSMEM